jgi:ACS family hexuronate transporter-like MFS transporter
LWISPLPGPVNSSSGLDSIEREEVNPKNLLRHNGRSTKPRSLGRVRWWIVWTLFFSTVINYISRQTFSLLVPVISAQYHLTNTDFGKISAAFQVAYAVTWLLGGIFLDVVGTRLGLALAVVFWSIVNMLTGFATSVFGFASFRFLLGIGEGLNWPGASKTVAEWFPSQERGLAVAIFDSGSSVGGAVAALSIPLIAIRFGWRSAFIVSGLVGFVWLLMWLRVYHPVDRHPRMTPAEVAHIRAGQEVPSVSPERGPRRWLKLARDRNVWGIVLGRALTDPIWWFYITWLPKYLSDARGFSLQRIALFAWMPFVAADVGNFTGGLVSGYCISRGVSVVRARKWVCVFSSLPILAGIPAAGVHSVYAAMALICFALWGYASWSTMGLTLPSDLFPHDVVATVTGLSGLAAGLVGAVFTIAVGILVDRFSYGPAFLVAGLMPLFATASILLLVRAPRIE